MHKRWRASPGSWWRSGEAFPRPLACEPSDLIVTSSNSSHPQQGSTKISNRMSVAGQSNGTSSPDASKRPADPITRRALQFTLSAREYELLHQYLIRRAPAAVQQSALTPARYERIVRSKTETGDYNVNTIRSALRVFGAAYVGLKAYDNLTLRLARRRLGPE